MGASGPLIRLGLSQYGLLQRGQRAGLVDWRGHQFLPHRLQVCRSSVLSVSLPDPSTRKRAGSFANGLEVLTTRHLEFAPPFYRAGAFVLRAAGCRRPAR